MASLGQDNSKGLHYNYRKQQLERIERDNQKIAKKIFGLKSDLNKDKFMTEFKEHQSYKANIIKIKKRTVPVHEGRAGHLPPLNNIGGHKSASHNS